MALAAARLWLQSRQQAARVLSAAMQHLLGHYQQQQQHHTRLLSTLQQTPDDSLFVGAYTPVTRQLWQDRLKLAQHKQPAGAAAPAPAAASPQPRPPKTTVIEYPFTSDRVLLELYRNPWGFLRIGRLLEDLDSLAGSIAFQHCMTPGGGLPLLVTVAVDAIELGHPVALDRDVVCQGQVVFTGGSSLDIRMELLQAPHAPEPSLVALFSFVLLDPETRKPAAVPPLLPQTDQEKAWAAERAAVAAQRKAARQAAASRGGEMTLAAAKQARLQELVQASELLRDMPSLAEPAWLSAEATSLSNTFVCQPQQRNMHGRIFGGFLMRRAFELGFATTYLFAGSRPSFVRVDEVTFRKPVDVGSLLRFKSHVVDMQYKPASTQQQRAGQQQQQQQQGEAEEEEAHIAVEVAAVISQPEQRDTTHTNTFRYIYRVALAPGQRLRGVVPSSPADVARLTRLLADEDW